MRTRLMLCAAALALAACGPAPSDPKKQIGANPVLPDIFEYLLPPMHVVKNVGWNGAVPKAAPGLQVKALARGLKNPRMVYVLPNGDVLVVESDGPKESVKRPKEFVMNWIEQQAHSSVKAGQRILLLRDNGSGTPLCRAGAPGGRLSAATLHRRRRPGCGRPSPSPSSR